MEAERESWEHILYAVARYNPAEARRIASACTHEQIAAAYCWMKAEEEGTGYIIEYPS